MVMRLYAIYDRKALETGPVFECKNNAVAFRSYKKLMENSPGLPSEYSLLVLGEVDHDTSCITGYPPPHEQVVEEVPNES